MKEQILVVALALVFAAQNPGSNIWLNGVPVWESSNELKQWRVDEDYRRVHLNKGRNKLLVRVENGWRALGWSVCISLDENAVASAK